MRMAGTINAEQAALWNGLAGQTWVEAQALLDQMFKPIEDLLIDAACATPPASVLDVGCGTGGTTLAVARRLGALGRCTGIDISEPMIALARARAQQEGLSPSFIRGDAQAHPLPPASFDRIISRFGVMFFDDPAGAFSNLRRAAVDGAELKLVAWRGAEENAFMTAAERAAAALLPAVPVRQPDAPGQFAFGDRRRVRHLLEQSGWRQTDIQPIDVSCTFPEAELDGYLRRLGPVGRMLAEADEQTRVRVLRIVRSAFDPYVHGRQVVFDAACWMISATA